MAAGGVIALALMSVSAGTVWEPTGLLFRSLLAITILVVAGLAIAVALRLGRQLRGRKFAEPVPRLQMRFITLFAVAAIAPAVLMAGFHALVLNRGIEFWFGERVTTLVDASAELGREWPNVALSFVQLQMGSLAEDLSDPAAVQGLQESRILYRNYLTQQAMLRNFPAVYVIDSQATVLARSDEAPDTPAFAAPTRFMFEVANDGDIGASDPVTRPDAPDYLRLLIAMPEYGDAYLYVVWYEDFSLLSAPGGHCVLPRGGAARATDARQLLHRLRAGGDPDLYRRSLAGAQRIPAGDGAGQQAGVCRRARAARRSGRAGACGARG